MKSNETSNGLQAKNIIRVFVGTALILSVPLMAMVFDWRVYDPGNPIPERVNWGPLDFVIMGILLMSVGFAYELLALKFKDAVQRIVLAVALLGLFLLIWAELAVGIFGTPFAGS